MSAVSGWIYVYNMHLTKNTKPETMPIIDTIFIYTYNIQLTEKTLLIQSFSSSTGDKESYKLYSQQLNYD